MKKVIFVLFLIVMQLSTSFFSWNLQVARRRVAPTESPPGEGNIKRKMRRQIIDAFDKSCIERILNNPYYHKYLVEKAKGESYKKIMVKLRKKAKAFGAQWKEGFGEKNRTLTTLPDYLASNANLTIFALCLEKTKILDNLEEGKLFTLFAPINEAFETNEVTAELIPVLKNSEGPEQADAISLLNETLSKHISASFIRTPMKLKEKDPPICSLSGSALRVRFSKKTKTVYVGGAIVTNTTRCQSCAIHVVGKLLSEDDFESE